MTTNQDEVKEGRESWERAKSDFRGFCRCEPNPLNALCTHCYDFRAIERLILSTLKDNGWRDIKDAPRDGRYILIMNFTGKVFVGYYIDLGDEEEGYWQHLDTLQVYYEPTHWQPLPPPPESEGV